MTAAGRPPYPLVVTLLAGLLAARLLAYAVFPVYDDAFITYRYAVNLVEVGQFTYNRDDFVLGTTAPLYGLLVALVHALGAPADQVTPFLNILCDVAICALIGAFVLGWGAPAFVAFVVLFAASPVSGRITVGGMEANLFVLAALGAIVLDDRGRKPAAAALAALAYFLRPEAVLLVALLCARALRAGDRRGAAVMGLVAGTVVAPVLAVFRLAYGQVLPQSVVAKGAADHAGIAAVLEQLVAPEPVAIALVALALAGADPALSRPGPLRTITLFAGLYLAAYLLRGPKMWSWYALPVQVTLCLLAAVGLAALLARLPVRRPRASPLALAAAGMAGAVVVWLGVLWQQGADRVTANVYRPLQEFCRESVAAGATILAGDIGIVGYACPSARIYDTAALVWPEATAYPDTAAIIRDRRPDYLFLVAATARSLQAAEAGLAARYGPLRRFARDGDPDPLRAGPAAGGWSQDYVLFRARAPAASGGGRC